MKYFRIVLVFLILCSTGFLSISVYRAEKEKQRIKEDLIELSKIKYGLFNVDEWKHILASIITKKIAEFNLDGANREKMQLKVSELLYTIIDDLEKRFYKENSGSVMGILKGGVVFFSGTFSHMKKDVPKFTEQVLDFVNEPNNKKALQGYIIEKLNDYADNTFSKIDYTTHDQLIKKYHYKNKNEAIQGLQALLLRLEQQHKPFKIGLLLLALLSGLFVLLSKKPLKGEYLILTLISLSLLSTGLILPMIEIDARISTMSFSLLGEPVAFEDQVLYYKSKSILEVVQLMVMQERYDMLLVGLLVFTFSVLFPLLKLVSSVLYLYVPGLTSNRFVRFMVFKTGKWSMADVMVIAIFMAYIGFSGIISEQLKQIENLAQNIDLLTTNKSSLLMGFFSFTSFALLSLLVSHKLQYGFKQD